jgi:hypothetical protein
LRAMTDAIQAARVKLCSTQPRRAAASTATHNHSMGAAVRAHPLEVRLHSFRGHAAAATCTPPPCVRPRRALPSPQAGRRYVPRTDPQAAPAVLRHGRHAVVRAGRRVVEECHAHAAPPRGTSSSSHASRSIHARQPGPLLSKGSSPPRVPAAAPSSRYPETPASSDRCRDAAPCRPAPSAGPVCSMDPSARCSIRSHKDWAHRF